MSEDYIKLYETLESVRVRLDELWISSDMQCSCNDALCSGVHDIAGEIEKVLQSVKRAHWSDSLSSEGNK